MVTFLMNSNGECTTCNETVNEDDILNCYDCKSHFHAFCGDEKPYGAKTFIGSFKKVKVSNFLFLCDVCLTKRENNEASVLKDQIAALTEKVETLINDFQSFKADKPQEIEKQSDRNKPWEDKV